jgi:hypothetical protein
MNKNLRQKKVFKKKPAIKTACSALNILLDAVPYGPSIRIYKIDGKNNYNSHLNVNLETYITPNIFNFI